VSRYREGRTEGKEFGNDEKGHRALIGWLGQQARVAMEATGVYHLQLAMALQAAGVEVMVVNPRVAKDFAGALSSRSKTDKVDAHALTEYVRRMAFKAWKAPSSAALELRELARRISELVKTATNEKNRLHARRTSSISATVIADVRAHIGQLEKRIKAMEAAALQVIGNDQELSEQFDRIKVARGFGRRTAVLLLGELSVLDRTMSVRQMVAHAGLDPRVYESGTSVQKAVRISKVGNARIRAVLFMNALSAIRHDRGARLFFACLVARGKKKMQAVVAVMRKLLHGLWTAIQRGVAFDASILFAASLAQAESSDSAVAATQPQQKQDHPKDRSAAEELRQQLDPASAKATRRRAKTKKVA
jgi:transposase